MVHLMYFYHLEWLFIYVAVRSTPKQEVRARPLARDVVLCSWTRHFTLTGASCINGYREFSGGGNPLMD